MSYRTIKTIEFSNSLFNSTAVLEELQTIGIKNEMFPMCLWAIGDDEIAAKSLGIETAKYKIQIFILSAIFASVAGSMYAHYLNFVSPSDVNIFFSIRLVIMVVIGGMTNIWGALIGAFVLTVLPELLTIFEDYDVLVFGIILVSMMLFMPKGIGSKLVSIGRLLNLHH